MHSDHLHDWQHAHVFGQDQQRTGERRTLWVIAITGLVMIVEIAAGYLFGSMALLADGLHMGSHAAALGISAFAYIYARRHAGYARFCFGTGKVNALAGFASAMLLVCFAAVMAWESVHRLLSPVAISFNSAIAVAVLGLLTNAVCVLILGNNHTHDHGHDHHHDHDHHHHGHGHEHDHNLRSAYLHVMADALTSVLAIAALVAGKYLGWNWLDPLMGIAGACLVGWWSWGLLRQTSQVLLDHQAAPDTRDHLRHALEAIDDTRVADCHVWSIGPGIHAAALTVVTHSPRPPEEYRAAIPDHANVVHSTIEIAICPDAT